MGKQKGSLRKIKLQVKRIEHTGLVVLSPVVDYREDIRDSSGKKLTAKQVQKAKAQPGFNKQHTIGRVLIENTDMWQKVPSARFQILPDTKEGRDMFAEGDVFEVTLKKL